MQRIENAAHCAAYTTVLSELDLYERVPMYFVTLIHQI